jgi:nitrite reductase/ring-hydroxylating ferredoxin subunit
MLRRYWQPVALAEELPPSGAPLPVRLLGEDLVLFRDEQGRPGLLGLHCAHRGADLSYGRLEDGGLRCLYHGWLYNVEGRCLEQPGEPAGSTFKDRVRQPAYPCREAGGLILAYLGPGEPPLLPAYAFLAAPEGHRQLAKLFQACSYLQGNEGNLDPSHLSFLHRVRRQTDHFEADTAPRIEVEPTDWGLRIYSIRATDAAHQYVRLTNMILPNLTAFRGLEELIGDIAGYSVQWHVPIDDTHHWKYALAFDPDSPLTREVVPRGLGQTTADGRLARNLANRYLQDRDEMRTETFTGMGIDFRVHDAWATESAGPIQDRTQEHLGASDVAIIRARQLLLRAVRDVQAGRDPQHVVRDPAANHFPDLVVRSSIIPTTTAHRTFWQEPVGAGGARAVARWHPA